MNKIDLDEDGLRKLAQILLDTGLTEIEYKAKDLSIKVKKGGDGAMAMPHFITAAAPSAAPSPSAGTSAQEPATPKGFSVTSPMVGVAYLSPEPSKPAFVKVGDTVKEGQTLLIIESMKVLNPITAPRAGVVKDVVVKNEQPVEFGEVLVVLD